MKYFDVIVHDRLSHEEVVVGSLMPLFEAQKLVRVLQELGCCDVRIQNVSTWFKWKGVKLK